MRAHFQHGARARPPGLRRAEARIEEAGVVDAEFTDQRIEWRHFRRMVGRHPHGLFRGEDVELAGVEDQVGAPARKHRLPEVHRVERSRRIDIDQPRKTLGAVADQLFGAEPREIDADRDAPGDRRLARRHQFFPRVQCGVARIVEPRLALAKADLAQPRAGAHQHWKSARRDFGKQRAAIARLDPVERPRPVRDDAGEHIDAAGRAFGVGRSGDVLRQGEAFGQFRQIDSPGLQHRALAQVDFVQRQPGDGISDRPVRAGQKARAQAPRPLAEAQV